MNRKGGLGRNLDALIPQSSTTIRSSDVLPVTNLIL